MLTSSARCAAALCGAAALAACGGLQSASTLGPAPAEPSNQRRLDAKLGCPEAHCIIVGNAPGYAKSSGNLLFFAENANKDARPVGKIAGSKTQLSFVTGVATDARNDLYAANW